MQDLLIDLGWKSALIAGTVLIACRALRGRAAGERVLMLRLGVAALLALPLLAWLAPPLELAVLPAEEIAAAAATVAGEALAAAEPDGPGALDLILLLYCAGAASILLRLGIGLLTLARWTRAALPVTDPHWRGAFARAAAETRQPVRLLVSPRVRAPMSWGVAPAWILIAPETERRSAQAEAVLAHEMAHVRRLDWPMLLLAQLATALLWFNPLVWWLGRSLAGQIEQAADEAAVCRVARLDYAQTLLAVGAGSAHRSACGMTYARSTLGQRIRDVLEAGPRRNASRLLCGAMLVAAVTTAAPLAALKFVPAEARTGVELAVENYVPVLIPQAQAQERALPAPPKPVPPRKRRKMRAPAAAPTLTAPVVPVASPLKPPAPAKPLAGPRPPQPPGAKATHGADKATRKAINEARRMAHATVAANRPRFVLRDRGTALGMTQAANGMRVKAATLEASAGNPAMPKETRNEHIRMASRLRAEAQKLDQEARQLIKP